MEYTIILTEQELQVISMALGELPLKVSINVFGKIQAQKMAAQTSNKSET